MSTVRIVEVKMELNKPVNLEGRVSAVLSAVKMGKGYAVTFLTESGAPKR